LFAVLGLGATFLSPTVNDIGILPLQLLFEGNTGARYWLIPLFTFAATLVFCLQNNNPVWIRFLAAALIACSMVGIVVDFRHRPLPDLRFNYYVSEYNHMVRGEVLRVPINPLGPEDWTMVLIKK
jgi:prepilin signal peptidase PulO-like enzyme (type II secretory pathway)